MKTIKFFVGLSILFALSSCVLDFETVSLEGQWSCEEESQIYLPLKGKSVYPVYFAQDAMFDNQYYIDNFYQLGSGHQISIMVTGGNTVVVSVQTVDGIRFEGSGTISSNSNTIELNFTADDGGGEVDHVIAIYTR